MQQVEDESRRRVERQIERATANAGAQKLSSKVRTMWIGWDISERSAKTVLIYHN